MADSAPAFAPSPNPSSSRIFRDPTATEAIAPRPHGAASLAFAAQCELEQLFDAHLAYACIEQLLDPAHLSDSGKIHATRSQFSALVWLVNKELQSRLESADAAIQSVREALEGGAPDDRPHKRASGCAVEHPEAIVGNAGRMRAGASGYI